MNRLWQEAVSQLEKTLSPQHFSTWIRPIRFLSLKKDHLVLEVPNRFVFDWVRDHYASLIQETVSQIGAVTYRVSFEIANIPKREQPRQQEDKGHIVASSPDSPRDTFPREWNAAYNLNPKYTFDEFVSGSSNQFAFAAASAVANNPATTYNPLFIYGGVGSGQNPSD